MTQEHGVGQDLDAKITVRRVDNTYGNKRMCQGELSRESSEQASVLYPDC